MAMAVDHANCARQTEAIAFQTVSPPGSRVRRWWGRLFGATAIAMITVPAVATRTARTHSRTPRSRPTRTAGPRSWAPRPRPRGRTIGAGRTLWTEPAVVVVPEMVGSAGRPNAGEEDDRNDENDARDDHHPRRDVIEPGVACHVRRRRAGRRLERGFGCLGHDLIMPTCRPAINQLGARVGRSATTRTPRRTSG